MYNPEKKRLYYEANREHILAVKRVYAKKNRAKINKRRKIWVALNRDKVREVGRKWNAENRKRYKGYRLKKRFGLTIQQFEAMKLAQANKCKICFLPFLDTPDVDHCHITGKVRGLLCGKCNKAIGLVGDSIEILRNAIAYLKEGKNAEEGSKA